MRKLLSTLVLVCSLIACQKVQINTLPAPSSAKQASESVMGVDHVLLGMPTVQPTDYTFQDTLLLTKNGFVIAYSRTLEHPHWVGWHVQKSNLGAVDRQNDFRTDNTLPDGWYRVKPTDYGAIDGFDRGHLCPSADRSDTEANNSETFLMTNIMPQAPVLNRGIWKALEDYCRMLVESGNEIYVMAGGYGYGAAGAQGFRTMLSSGKVKPTRRCWKIIVVLSEGSDDLKRVDAQTKVIVVDMPNSQTNTGSWKDYIVTLSDLEKSTGYTFLTALPKTIRVGLREQKYIVPAVITSPPPMTTSSPTTATVTLPGTVTIAPGPTPTPPIPVTVTPPAPITVTLPTPPPVVTPPAPATITPPVTVTTASPATGDVKCGTYNGRQLFRGPKDGCYYINSNGNKTYVDRSYCKC